MWRASFSELARWWRWRGERRWLVIPREDDRLEIQFDEWDTEYALAVDIQRGKFQCSVPVTSPRMSLGLRGLVYERGGAGRGFSAISVDGAAGFLSSARSRPRSTGRR